MLLFCFILFFLRWFFFVSQKWKQAPKPHIDRQNGAKNAGGHHNLVFGVVLSLFSYFFTFFSRPPCLYNPLNTSVNLLIHPLPVLLYRARYKLSETGLFALRDQTKLSETGLSDPSIFSSYLTVYQTTIMIIRTPYTIRCWENIFNGLCYRWKIISYGSWGSVSSCEFATVVEAVLAPFLPDTLAKTSQKHFFIFFCLRKF